MKRGLKRKGFFILFSALLLSLFPSLSGFSSPQLGLGIGEMMPDSLVSIKTFGDLPLMDILSFRASLDLASAFNVLFVPLEGLLLFPLKLSLGLEAYLGGGGGLTSIISTFGLKITSSYTLVGGVKLYSTFLPLFFQLQVRGAGAHFIYQLDAGILLEL